jgi:prepilin-type N-terminal cleavage/methylation domain-containing protein
MEPRGTTLIELMVVVAIVGISVGTLGAAATHQRLAGLAELQRERAAQLLEYHAECLSSGRQPAPAILDRLRDGLPSANVQIERRGQTVTITVTWKSMNNLKERRALVVFAKGG